MVRDLLVRGFDDEIHSKLGKIADTKGVSLNSIVKDAVDKWLKQQTEIPKKHDLIIYANDLSMQSLIKSIDRLAKEGNWFRCFCAPPTHLATKLLERLEWFDGTIKPYNPKQKNIGDYCCKVMERVAKESDKEQVCCTDFILGDVARSDLKQAVEIEHEYNQSRIPGLMFCPYKTETLLAAGIEDMMELFTEHDQIFILKNDELFKLHVSKENVHKLFLT
ncbi:MAG: hypothetical protein ACT4OD_03875 [Candidatus Nitrosotenuis sp.]